MRPVQRGVVAVVSAVLVIVGGACGAVLGSQGASEQATRELAPKEQGPDAQVVGGGDTEGSERRSGRNGGVTPEGGPGTSIVVPLTLPDGSPVLGSDGAPLTSVVTTPPSAAGETPTSGAGSSSGPTPSPSVTMPLFMPPLPAPPTTTPGVSVGPGGDPVGSGGLPIAATPSRVPMCINVVAYLQAGNQFTLALRSPAQSGLSIAGFADGLVTSLTAVIDSAPAADRPPLQALRDTMPPVIVALRRIPNHDDAVATVRAYLQSTATVLSTGLDSLAAACPGLFRPAPALPTPDDYLAGSADVTSRQ